MIRSAFCTMYPSLNARALGLDLPAKETLELAARRGSTGVDLLVRDLVEAGDDPRELRATDGRPRPAGRGLALARRTGGADAERFAHDLGRLPRLAEAAAVLGLTRTGTWVMPETPERPESETARADHLAAIVGLHLERLGRDRPRLGRASGSGSAWRSSASRRSAPVAVGPSSTDWPISTACWARSGTKPPTSASSSMGSISMRRARRSRRDWCGESIASSGSTSPTCPRTATPDRAAIRDDDRGLPGENGAIDSQSLLQRLAEAGYDGPVTAEPLARVSLAGGSDSRKRHTQRAASRYGRSGRRRPVPVVLGSGSP